MPIRLRLSAAAILFSSLLAVGCSHSSSDADRCVQITPTPAQLVCKADTDCVWVTAGDVCADEACRCPTATANAASAGPLESQAPPISATAGPGCSCPSGALLTGRTPACVQGACALVSVDAGS